MAPPPERKHNASLTSLSRALRKNMTPEERRLWYDYLKSYPIPFHKQKVLGHYIADFYCAKAKIVIELDGSQHGTVQGQQSDEIRTAFLEQYDLMVIRIPNMKIRTDFFCVCDYIDAVVKQRFSQFEKSQKE